MDLKPQDLVNFRYLEENKEYYKSCFFKNYKDYLKEEFKLLDQKIKNKKLVFMFKHYLKQIKHIIYNNRNSIIKLNLNEQSGSLILNIQKQDNTNYRMIIKIKTNKIIYELFVEDKCFYRHNRSIKNKPFLKIFLLFITQDKFSTITQDKFFTKKIKSNLKPSCQLLNKLDIFERELFEMLQPLKQELINNLKINNFLELESDLFHNPTLDFYIYIWDIEIDTCCYVVYKYSFDSKEDVYNSIISHRTNIYDFFDTLNILYNEHK